MLLLLDILLPLLRESMLLLSLEILPLALPLPLSTLEILLFVDLELELLEEYIDPRVDLCPLTTPLELP